MCFCDRPPAQSVVVDSLAANTTYVSKTDETLIKEYAAKHNMMNKYVLTSLRAPFWPFNRESRACTCVREEALQPT